MATNLLQQMNCCYSPPVFTVLTHNEARDYNKSRTEVARVEDPKCSLHEQVSCFASPLKIVRPLDEFVACSLMPFPPNGSASAAGKYVFDLFDTKPGIIFASRRAFSDFPLSQGPITCNFFVRLSCFFACFP